MKNKFLMAIVAVLVSSTAYVSAGACPMSDCKDVAAYNQCLADSKKTNKKCDAAFLEATKAQAANTAQQDDAADAVSKKVSSDSADSASTDSSGGSN